MPKLSFIFFFSSMGIPSIISDSTGGEAGGRCLPLVCSPPLPPTGSALFDSPEAFLVMGPLVRFSALSPSRRVRDDGRDPHGAEEKDEG